MAGFSSLICLLEYRIGGSVFEVTNLIFWGALKIMHGTFWPVSANGRGHHASAQRATLVCPMRAHPIALVLVTTARAHLAGRAYLWPPRAGCIASAVLLATVTRCRAQARTHVH